MDGRTFSDTYRQPTTGRYHPDHERASLMAPVYEWSDRFSEIIHSVLRQEPLNEHSTHTTLLNYLHWAGSDLHTIAEEVIENIDPINDSHNLSTLNFHFINAQMFPIWLHVASGSRSLSGETVRAVQNNLAASGVSMLAYRAKILESEDYQDISTTLPWLADNGVLNEIDTLITSLELTIQHPHIAVLAAPGMFESSYDSSKNNDILVVDLKSPNRDTHGIQTKMSINAAIREKADPTYVTLIDGRVDLDSTKAVRANHRSSKVVTAPWPGQIAMHHLIAMKKAVGLDSYTKRKLSENARRQGTVNPHVQGMHASTNLLRAKSEAHRLATTESKSQNKKVAARVIERVMNDLYK